MSARILIVEDDEDIARNLRELLEGEGHVVEWASNGRVALDYLRGTADRPSFILLDLMMPVMDGYEFRTEQEKEPPRGMDPCRPHDSRRVYRSEEV